MRRITLTSTALALLLLLGGVAIAGATPAAKPGDTARTLRFDVQFSPFKLIDVDGDGAPSLGTTWSSATCCWFVASRSVTRAAPARSWTPPRA